LSYVDLIPQEFYHKIIDFSFRYIFWMMENEPTFRNIQIFSNACINEIINPIKSNLAPGKSRIPVLQEVFNKNIPFIHLGQGIYQIGWGNNSRKIDRSTIDADSATGLHLSQNKITTVNLLKMAGFPSPFQSIAKSKEQLLNIIKELNFPVVVKPIDLDRGEGVTVDIYDYDKLILAFNEAISLSKSKNVIVEKQVSGVCHRLFIANNELLYCVKRLPISIKANGKSTIEELIDSTNEKESQKFFWIEKDFFPKDSLTLEVLKKVGYTLKSIPKKDIWIELRDIESTQWGGRDENMTNLVHPDNLDIAIRATKLFDLNVAGVDIITTDISKSWIETKAVINEINYAPLLGGAEISKSYIPTFIDKFMEKNGRIPIEVFVGNNEDTLVKAKEKLQEYSALGFKSYFTNHDMSFDHKLNQINFLSKSISNRIQALLLNSNVEALIIVVQNSEFLYNFFPIDKVLNLNIISNEIVDIKTNKNLNENDFKLLIDKLT
jgi:cyanophycin synthetase